VVQFFGSIILLIDLGRRLLNYVFSDPYVDVALVGDDIESQAHQALTNLGRIPEAAGSSWDKVFKVNCILVHAKRVFAEWNRIFDVFPESPPGTDDGRGRHRYGGRADRGGDHRDGVGVRLPSRSGDLRLAPSARWEYSTRGWRNGLCLWVTLSTPRCYTVQNQ
jgi:hypothetical protein